QDHRDAPLATHEQGVLDAVRAALPTLLATVVQTSTRALEPAQATWRTPCPGCGRRRKPRHRARARLVAARCGPPPVSPPALLVCALPGGLEPRRQLPRDRAARAGERGAGRVAGAVGGGGRACARRRAGGRPRGALWVARARGG